MSSSSMLNKPIFPVLSLSFPATLTLGLPLLPSEKTCDFAAASVSGFVVGFLFFFFLYILWQERNL